MLTQRHASTIMPNQDGHSILNRIQSLQGLSVMVVNSSQHFSDDSRGFDAGELLLQPLEEKLSFL